MAFNSAVFMYLSVATRFSIRSMMRTVVSTPTSEVMRISSRLSNTSSSTFDLPATARANLENTPSLVLARPLFRSSLFSFFEKRLNSPISICVLVVCIFGRGRVSDIAIPTCGVRSCICWLYLEEHYLGAASLMSSSVIMSSQKQKFPNRGKLIAPKIQKAP